MFVDFYSLDGEMPIPNLKAANTLDVMKSEEGNDSLDAVIRQAIGKEPFLSFPKAGDSSVQFIQLLQALEQQGMSLLMVSTSYASRSFVYCRVIIIIIFIVNNPEISRTRLAGTSSKLEPSLNSTLFAKHETNSYLPGR